MPSTLALRRSGPPPVLLLTALLLLLLLVLYYQFRSVQSATDPLVQHLSQTTGIDAPPAVFAEAIRETAKKLSEALGIDLNNYDLTQAEYETLVEAAVRKFGLCEQYRLYAVSGGQYNCYTCPTRPRIMLQAGQTYRIGETCLGETGRYREGLPEPGLVYLAEFVGNIFEVLVAENVKLLLFRMSHERKAIIKANNLGETELLLPPANKILR